jgi:hypothetical protein
MVTVLYQREHKGVEGEGSQDYRYSARDGSDHTPQVKKKYDFQDKEILLPSFLPSFEGTEHLLVQTAFGPT